MKRIDSRIKIGTLVKLKGVINLCTVTKIYGGTHNRNWVEVSHWAGSFQAEHIEFFTNKLSTFYVMFDDNNGVWLNKDCFDANTYIYDTDIITAIWDLEYYLNYKFTLEEPFTQYGIRITKEMAMYIKKEYGYNENLSDYIL